MGFEQKHVTTPNVELSSSTSPYAFTLKEFFFIRFPSPRLVKPLSPPFV